MNLENDIFKALAHPARRKIISLLSVSVLSVKEMTAEFRISQPAISQHLRELKAAKIVKSTRAGLEQKYILTGKPLKIVFSWAAQYRRFFDPSGYAWEFAPAENPPKPAPGRRRSHVHGR